MRPVGQLTAVWKTALLVYALLLLCARPAFAKYNPSFSWTVLETPHFLIHYHRGGEEIAARAARIAEDVHNRLVPRIKWEPKEKTRIVLVDANDDPNGAASPIPYNLIEIFLTPPSGSLSLGLISYDDWLRLVITHEYTHILQLDMVKGLPSALQYVFGRIYFPNMFQPRWLIEGLATYEETEETNGGRGRSPASDMMLRMAILEKGFPSLGQMSVLPDSWPGGQVPYIFGESFIRFIADKYGRDGLAEISEVYSGRTLPFLVESTALRTLGKSYGDLWEEWKYALRERFEQQASVLRAARLTESKQLTSRGFMNASPAFSPDGKQIAYSVVHGDEYPGIYLAASDGSGEKKIVENVFPAAGSGSSLAWSPDGEYIYYTRIEINENTASYNDIYRFAVSTGREERITKGLRAKDPHVSPDGNSLIFVMNRLGMTRLAVLNLHQAGVRAASEKDLDFLTPWTSDQYETPRWSPDGSSIACGRWQEGGYRDVVILNREGSIITDVTKDRAIDNAPVWSPDGKLLYFSSDRSGVFNIYAFDMETRSLRQVTNVLGGAFSPSVSPDGKTMAIALYSSRGFDIHTINLDADAWKKTEPYEDFGPSIKYENQALAIASRPYSPLSTIYPRFWLPTIGVSPENGTLFGAFTFNEDALQRHRYLASVYYGSKNNRTWYSLDYFYEGFYPSLQFHTSDSDATHSGFFSEGMLERDYVERSKMIGGVVIIPVLKNRQQQWLIIEYQQKRISALTDFPPWPGYKGPLPGQGMLAAVRVAYRYTSSHRYGLSISPEDGRMLEAGAERFDKSFGSDFEYTRYTADLHEFISLPWKHHVLSVRAFAGAATTGTPAQGAFELGGDSLGDITSTLDDWIVTLRGYPPNVLRGRRAAVGGIEYRFPITNIERGSDTAPLFLRRLHGAVFFEAGSAWDDAFHAGDLRKSAGAELRYDITFAYYLPVTLRLVFAKGLDKEGESQLYFGFWVPMELF